MADKTKNTYATASYVLGWCSIVAWLIPLVGFPVTIVGIIMGVKGQRSELESKAKTGLFLNIVFLVVTALNSAVGMFMGLGVF